MAFGTQMKLKRKAKIIVDTVYKEGKSFTEAGMRIWPNQSREVANVSIQQDLQKPSVIQSVKEQLDEIGLTDVVLDKELKKIVKQDEMLSPKLSAIVEANKLKARYPKENVQQQHLHLHGVDSSNIDAKINELKIQIDSLV